MAHLMSNASQATRAEVRQRPESDARSIDSRLLLGHDGSINIRHGDQVYNLRQTRTGKLILTK